MRVTAATHPMVARQFAPFLQKQVLLVRASEKLLIRYKLSNQRGN